MNHIRWSTRIKATGHFHEWHARRHVAHFRIGRDEPVGNRCFRFNICRLHGFLMVKSCASGTPPDTAQRQATRYFAFVCASFLAILHSRNCLIPISKCQHPTAGIGCFRSVMGVERRSTNSTSLTILSSMSKNDMWQPAQPHSQSLATLGFAIFISPQRPISKLINVKQLASLPRPSAQGCQRHSSIYLRCIEHLPVLSKMLLRKKVCRPNSCNRHPVQAR